MSGVMGPLETRTITTMATPAALTALDASPFNSGELAWVTSLATGMSLALFVLKREDITSVVDNVNVIAVGPTGSAGRWLRLDVSAIGSGASNEYVDLDSDVSTGSLVFVPLLLANDIVTTAPANILIQASASGDAEPAGTVTYGLRYNGVLVVGTGAQFSYSSDGEGDIEAGSFSFVLENAPAGPQVIELMWKVSLGGIARIQPFAQPDQGQTASIFVTVL